MFTRTSAISAIVKKTSPYLKRLTVRAECVLKSFVISVVLCLLVSVSYADSFKVPFRCYKRLLIQEFAKFDINLNDEDPNADGFIENRGAEYIIHTYEKPSNVQLYVDIPVKVMQEMRDK